MRRARARGFVLLLVLMLLLVLSLMAAGFYIQAQDLTATTRIGMAQQIAVANADLGLQEGLRALRTMEITAAGIGGTCTDQQITDDTCTFTARSGIIAGNPTAELAEGGGLQYEYIVYRRTSTDLGQLPNRYVIRSNGYYGYSLTSATLVTSVVEMELELGVGTRFACTGGGYECQ